MTTLLVPGAVLAFFGGSGGINLLASPLFLKKHTGSDRVYLARHDIYHAGKDKNGKPVYTVYRLTGKEYTHNTIQGMLRVKLLSGYGVKHGDEERGTVLMRPNDLKKLMTEGTTSIKRNSVVVFETGMVVRLEDIEIFCDLPLIDKRELMQKDSAGAICKRDMYKATRGEDNWAHVKQGALIREMESSVHQLILPYYRRYKGNEKDPQHFFRAFMEDMVRTCTAHHTNFTDGCDFDKMLGEITETNRKRSIPQLQTETRPRKKWGGKSDGINSQIKAPDAPYGPEASKAPEATKSPKGHQETDPVAAVLKHVSREKLARIIF
jgi:hypothetical protein